MDHHFKGKNVLFNIILVDDGSNEHLDYSFELECIKSIKVLKLRRNMGHQRAIALGLCHINQNYNFDLVIVMDGDGEDSPAGVEKLLNSHSTESTDKIIFARRGKRSEGILFKLFYRFYKLFYRLLTGKKIQSGNFSLITKHALERLVGVTEIWNHYAAAIYRANIPLEFVTVNRAHRLDGKSKMNFQSLLTHGLSSISVFSDIVGLRFLIGSIMLFFITLLALCAVFVIRFFTEFSIPGWATYSAGLIIQILLLSFMFSIIFIFMTLQGRNISSFLPIRDYHHFIIKETDIYGN